ncbi:hypothetical protein GCM10023216_02650 [Isoptericola chiayiensis]|uniref:Uncharacterized protein n=1 Tax=Isoptericola chiayiensis TaxID=579446 RepID=A0ABP8XZ21_9MICO
MRIKGTSDFAVKSPLGLDAAVEAVKRVLEDFADRNPSVSAVQVEVVHSDEIRIEIVASGTYARLDDELDELADRVSSALQAGEATVSRGLTSLVPS